MKLGIESVCMSSGVAVVRWQIEERHDDRRDMFMISLMVMQTDRTASEHR